MKAFRSITASASCTDAGTSTWPLRTHRRRYVFINIENAGDNGTLNRTAEMYHNEGYNLDREKSTDRLLVFVKSEEVKKD